MYKYTYCKLCISGSHWVCVICFDGFAISPVWVDYSWQAAVGQSFLNALMPVIVAVTRQTLQTT